MQYRDSLFGVCSVVDHASHISFVSSFSNGNYFIKFTYISQIALWSFAYIIQLCANIVRHMVDIISVVRVISHSQGWFVSIIHLSVIYGTKKCQKTARWPNRRYISYILMSKSPRHVRGTYRPVRQFYWHGIARLPEQSYTVIYLDDNTLIYIQSLHQ
jgi:hypothetical protein